MAERCGCCLNQAETCLSRSLPEHLGGTRGNRRAMYWMHAIDGGPGNGKRARLWPTSAVLLGTARTHVLLDHYNMGLAGGWAPSQRPPPAAERVLLPETPGHSLSHLFPVVPLREHKTARAALYTHRCECGRNPSLLAVGPWTCRVNFVHLIILPEHWEEQ